MLVLVAIALFFLTALVTYNPVDPGWSYTGSRNGIHNAAGVVGAWFSDVLFSMFGYLAYLLPVMIAYSGWLVMRGTRSDADGDEINYRVLGLRWAGFFVTLASGCALTSLHFVLPAEILPIDGGGILGQWLGDGLAGVLGLLGSTLILLAVLLAGITLFSGLSWFRVIDLVGAFVLGVYDWVANRLMALVEYLQERKAGEVAKQRRQEVFEADKQKTAERKAKGSIKVRIEPVMKKVEISERLDREKQIALFDTHIDTELPTLRLLYKPQPYVKGFNTEALEAL